MRRSVMIMAVATLVGGVSSCTSVSAEANARLHSLANPIRVDKMGSKIVEDSREAKACCEDLSQCEANTNANCLAAFSVSSKQYTAAQWTEISLSIVGALAGSVGVPALTTANAAKNAVWITSLGGLSGATNAINATRASEGASANDIAEARSAFLQVYFPLMEKYSTAASTHDTVGMCKSLLDVRMQCNAYLYGFTTGPQQGDSSSGN